MQHMYVANAIFGKKVHICNGKSVLRYMLRYYVRNQQNSYVKGLRKVIGSIYDPLSFLGNDIAVYHRTFLVV